jgi:hypothetical protein
MGTGQDTISVDTQTTQQSTTPLPYCVPCNVVMAGLGIAPHDLDRHKVTVSSSYLRFLLTQIAATIPIDIEYYAEHNPDVREALEAEEVPSYAWHFQHTGWFEGRWPYEIPFSAESYQRYYRDLADFNDEMLRAHFDSTGYWEGRGGIYAHSTKAESWRLGKVIIEETE